MEMKGASLQTCLFPVFRIGLTRGWLICASHCRSWAALNVFTLLYCTVLGHTKGTRGLVAREVIDKLELLTPEADGHGQYLASEAHHRGCTAN